MIFDFLWHLRGFVRLDPKLDDAAVLDRIEQMLERQKKPMIERGQHSVIFEESFWSNYWSSSWRATVIYNQGQFWIDRDLEGRKLRYDLCSLHGFVFCLFAALLGFVFFSVGAGVQLGLKVGALAFAWVYGMNILTALIRVPGLIKRSVLADETNGYRPKI